MLTAHRTIGRLIGVTAGVAALAVTAAIPAGATTPADFNAPIFGTTSTLTALRMPSLADVTCNDAQCTQGVLPGKVYVDPAKYGSPVVAKGGAFSTSAGFVAKVNKAWDAFAPSGDGQVARLTLILADFAAGTDAAAVVATDAATMDVSLTGPTDVNGVQTWTYTASDANGGDALVYAALGTTVARGICGFGVSVQAQKPCSLANMTSLLIAAMQRPASADAGFDATVKALVPATPTGLVPIIMSAEKSPLMWSVYQPARALAKALASTQTASMQYQVKGFPALYLMATVAPLKANVGALAKKVCAPWYYGCTASAISGPASGYLATLTPHQGAKTVIGYSALFAGGGKLASINCSTINLDRALSAKERKACAAAIAGLSNAIVR